MKKISDDGKNLMDGFSSSQRWMSQMRETDTILVPSFNSLKNTPHNIVQRHFLFIYEKTVLAHIRVETVTELNPVVVYSANTQMFCSCENPTDGSLSTIK